MFLSGIEGLVPSPDSEGLVGSGIGSEGTGGTISLGIVSYCT